MAEFDYVVVGGGSAGCVLAARLSETTATVLLLEAGGEARSPWLHVPIGFARTRLNPQTDWCYPVAAQDPAQPPVLWPRGKVLGGSSAINGLIYARGQASDYDHWRQLGNAGWSFDDVLPYFKRSEARAEGDAELRGRDGPLTVSDGTYDKGVAAHFIAAAQQIGIPYNEDYNGATIAGVSWGQYTIRNGRRWSSASAYLEPVRQRPNLTVITDAHTTRVISRDGRIAAVEYQHGTEAPQQVGVRREAILAAGAIASPQLLELSGIGDGERLQALGIPVVHHLPGVGENLQDHYHTRLEYRLSKPLSLNDALRTPLHRLRAGIHYALNSRGPLSMGASPAFAFVCAGANRVDPDMQIYCFPYTVQPSGRDLQKTSGFLLTICSLRPESRGHVHAASNDWHEPPTITPNFLATEYDAQTLLAGMKIGRRIAAAPAMREVIAYEHAPGDAAQTDEELLRHARTIGGTSYHPTGTCRMGQDAMAVVDARLRVHGMKGLRVVDASIMPTVVSGNTNAPVMMIAEKAADMIRQDA